MTTAAAIFWTDINLGFLLCDSVYGGGCVMSDVHHTVRKMEDDISAIKNYARAINLAAKGIENEDDAEAICQLVWPILRHIARVNEVWVELFELTRENVVNME